LAFFPERLNQKNIYNPIISHIHKIKVTIRNKDFEF